MTFEALRLTKPLLRALASEGYSTPTPIQQEAIPHVLEGRDLLGCAQTGTGKTAAFALPILQRLGQTPSAGKARQRRTRALVLSPTRELAMQIGESFGAYGRHTGLRHTVVNGGVSQHPQVRAFQRGVDILVATPGRLLDLMGQGVISLHWIEAFVLDEADRMLDMGFINDIRKIVGHLPNQRQTLLFSATMPADIRQLAAKILSDPVRVQVDAESAPAETVDQSVYFVDKKNKTSLLRQVLDQDLTTRTLVFTRTKHGADRVVRDLSRAGIRAEAIHGNKTQSARQRVLGNFKSNRTAVLVATDIAARGIDVDSISHVINYDVPNEPETYVHRIGRTGRAGAAGIAISFCDSEERGYLKAIERLICKSLLVQKSDLSQATARSTQAVPQSAAPRRRKSATAGPKRPPQAGGSQGFRGRKRSGGPGRKMARS